MDGFWLGLMEKNMFYDKGEKRWKREIKKNLNREGNEKDEEVINKKFPFYIIFEILIF